MGYTQIVIIILLSDPLLTCCRDSNGANVEARPDQHGGTRGTGLDWMLTPLRGTLGGIGWATGTLNASIVAPIMGKLSARAARSTPQQARDLARFMQDLVTDSASLYAAGHVDIGGIVVKIAQCKNDVLEILTSPAGRELSGDVFQIAGQFMASPESILEVDHVLCRVANLLRNGGDLLAHPRASAVIQVGISIVGNMSQSRTYSSTVSMQVQRYP